MFGAAILPRRVTLRLLLRLVPRAATILNLLARVSVVAPLLFTGLDILRADDEHSGLPPLLHRRRRRK